MLTSSKKLFSIAAKARAVVTLPSVRLFNPPVHNITSDLESDSTMFSVQKRNYYKSYFENGHAPRENDVKIQLAEEIGTP